MEEGDYLEGLLVMTQALYEIVIESTDAEIVKLAIAALAGTKAGRKYLEQNPLKF